MRERKEMGRSIVVILLGAMMCAGWMAIADGSDVNHIRCNPDIPFFGIEEDFDKSNDIVSLSWKDMRDLGVKIVRTHGGPFVWDSIEPRKGEFDFTATDRAVREAFYSGVSIIASLWPYAMWDQGDREECKVSGRIDAMRGRVPDYRCKPQDMEAYRSFLKELVERYDGDDDFGSHPISEEMKEIIRRNPVIYWEIDNEVDAGDNREYAKFFVGTLEDYVDLLKNSYEAIKEACEECQVIVAAPAGSIRDYYSRLFSLGARDYFDIYNLHEPIRELKETVGTLDKPVFITEAGGKEGAELAKEAISLAGEGVTLAILSMVPDWPKYHTKDIGDDPKRKEEFFKGYLLSKDGSKASAYYTLQTLTTELEYFNAVEPVVVGIGVSGFKFYFEGKDPVYVLFINELGGAEKTVLVDFEGFTVKDLWGAERAMEGKSFTLERDNIYFVKPRSADEGRYVSPFIVAPPSDTERWHFGTLAFDYKYVPLIMDRSAIAEEFDREARVAAQAGAYWIRPHLTELFAWGFTERKQGEYDWEILDLLVRTCQRYRIHLLPQLWTTSRWDRNLKPGDPTDAHHAFFTLGVWPWTRGEAMRPKDMSAYLRWLKALVERYDRDGVADMDGLEIPIRHYEILNEPDIRDDLAPFLEVQRRSYEAIKEVNSDVAVVLGGQMSPRELAACLEQGIASYCDVINVHGFLNEEYQRVLRKFDVNKPIWITEIGYEFERFIGESMDEERRQAMKLVKLYARSFARGADKIFWIEMLGQVKPPIEWEHPIPWEQQGACLYPSEKGPRLAYFTHQLMASKIGAFTDAREVHLKGHRDVECYRFTSDGNPVYILWLNRKGLEFVDLEVPYTSVRVTEMMPLDKTGRFKSFSLKPEGGVIHLKLSEIPVLIAE